MSKYFVIDCEYIASPKRGIILIEVDDNRELIPRKALQRFRDNSVKEYLFRDLRIDISTNVDGDISIFLNNTTNKAVFHIDTFFKFLPMRFNSDGNLVPIQVTPFYIMNITKFETLEDAELYYEVNL